MRSCITQVDCAASSKPTKPPKTQKKRERNENPKRSHGEHKQNKKEEHAQSRWVDTLRGPVSIRWEARRVVVIATRGSKNSKTGDMVQTWILRSDVKPTEAVKTGEDESICGDCPHRHFLSGACYVQPFQAPRSVWEKYKRGGYRHATESDFTELKEMKVRAGSYGDPSAVPLWVWVSCGVSTGYSRQWRNFTEQSHYLMASVISIREKREANALGFRTFRMASPESPVDHDEIICPSASGVSCFDCGLCAGSRIGAKNIVIEVHGARSKRALEIIQ